MDYQGNYFPDEPDENQSKVYKNIKGFFKWTMYGISFVIYALIFFILFINRDSKILEKNYIHTLPEFEDLDTDDLEQYRINTITFMNDDGSIQLYNVDYFDDLGVMEIGIKYNAKKNTDGVKTEALEYILSDYNGNEFPIINCEEHGRGRYGFARIAFNGIDINLDSNDLRFDKEKALFVRTKEHYTLKVIRKSDNELLYEFLVYDNSTTFNSTEYNK